MKNSSRKLKWSMVLSAVVAGMGLSGHAYAYDPLYDSTNGATVVTTSFTSVDSNFSSGNSTMTFSTGSLSKTVTLPSPINSFADDYDTGFQYVVVNGLSFVGGLFTTDQYANANIDHLTIMFYSLSGVRVATIYPEDNVTHGFGLHSLPLGDFKINGTQGITLPGKGYVIFVPGTYNLVDLGTTPPTVTPGDPNPIPFSLGFGQAPTLGKNDVTISATTANYAGPVTTGAYAQIPSLASDGTTILTAANQYAQFSLQGFGYGAIPGDTNLDGKISIDDYLAIDNGYIHGTSGWANGDFNHDGVINAADYALIDANYHGPTAAGEISLHTAEFGVAYTDALAVALQTAAVPEPGTIGVLALGAAALIRRRHLNRHAR